MLAVRLSRGGTRRDVSAATRAVLDAPPAHAV